MTRRAVCRRRTAPEHPCQGRQREALVHAPARHRHRAAADSPRLDVHATAAFFNAREQSRRRAGRSSSAPSPRSGSSGTRTRSAARCRSGTSRSRWSASSRRRSWMVAPAPGDDQFDAVYIAVHTVHRLLNLSKLNDITDHRRVDRRRRRACMSEVDQAAARAPQHRRREAGRLHRDDAGPAGARRGRPAPRRGARRRRQRRGRREGDARAARRRRSIEPPGR